MSRTKTSGKQDKRISERAWRRNRITLVVGVVSVLLFVTVILVSVIAETAQFRSQKAAGTAAESRIPVSAQESSETGPAESDTQESDRTGTNTAEAGISTDEGTDVPPDSADTETPDSGYDTEETDPADTAETIPQPVEITDAGRWLDSTVMEPYPSWCSGSDAEEIIKYLAGGAPLRWDVIYSDEGTVSYGKRYPDLSYYYYDISNGSELAYDADRVRYAASLSKLPFIYSVLLEIEAYRNDPHADPSLQSHYDLGAEWIYDPYTMFSEGSGIIQEEKAGFRLTVGELLEYAVKYSDNVAFAWLQGHFGLSSYFELLDRLGISGGHSDPYMDFSARDCGRVLYSVYLYFENGSELSSMLRDWMADSDLDVLIPSHFPAGTVPHKYGWDIDSFHDMAVILEENPYILVIMTDYEDGDQDRDALDYFSKITELTKTMHGLSED